MKKEKNTKRKSFLRRRCFAGCLILVGVLWPLLGCSDRSGSRSPDRPDEQLFKQWQKECRREHVSWRITKDSSFPRLRVLKDLLGRLPPKELQELHERRLSDTEPPWPSISATRAAQTRALNLRELEAALVCLFTERQDRKRLQELLSRRPIDGIGIMRLEFYLAQSSLPDPIRLLADSYHQGTPMARKSLLFGLSWGFKRLRKEISEDDAFVEACAVWCETHASELRLNREFILSPGPDDMEEFRTRELYLLAAPEQQAKQ